MAADTKGRPTFPVWVGNLKETVGEEDLKKLFARCGSVASYKVMRDKKTGKSRLFGYVNFCTRADAENAASKLQGRDIHGVTIRTAGPAELERKGHYSPEKDFRPLIDCSFFIQGNKCKKGDACPFRHSKQALATQSVCPQWANKQCTNKHCPMRHPGGMERKSGPSGGTPPPPESQVYQCGGRCGNVTCTLSFSSNLTLMQHIQHGRLQCTYCKIVFGSESELRGHKKVCYHRTDSTSTDTPSPSLSDVEVLSDSESTASEDMSQLLPLNHSPMKSGGAKGNRKRGRRKRSSSGSSTNAARVTGPTKSFSETRMSAKWPLGMPENRSYSAVYNQPQEAQLEDGSDGFEGVSFGNWSDLSESSDEEDLTYTSAEMARLLSLNEQDMYPHMESEEEEEEEGEEEEGEGENNAQDDVVNDRVGLGDGGGWRQGEYEEVVAEKKQKAKRRRKKKETSTSGATDEATPTGVHPHSSHAHPSRFGQPEPVGLFWDIENCSVPPNRSAFAVATKMRKVFFEGKREAEFMVVCDITKEKKEVTDALHKAQVTLVHVSAVAKNAADDKLRQSLRRFAHTYPAPSTVVLVSGDVNFSSELNDLRHVHNLTIVLVHSRFTSDALKVFAHTLVDYEQFLEGVEAPKEAVRPSLPNIVLVSNLPHHIPHKKLQNRLNQLSDNCGGKVLRVDPASGTARILFRTPEWAMKAEKRIKGEDVFGSKIATCLDYSAPLHPSQRHQQPSQPPTPPFPQPPPPGSQLEFRRLSGTALGRTYPPTAPPPPNHPLMQPSPPPPRSGHPYRHPFLPPPPQPFPPHGFPPPQMSPPSTRPPFSPPQMHPPSLAAPPTPPAPTPLFPAPSAPFSPPFRPPPPQPPLAGPSPYSQVAATPAPRPEGKILIFKIPPTEERSYETLDRQILMVALGASIKAEHLILWHSHSEMQVLLKLDFHQTATVRKEEMVRTLWEKGDLRPKLAQAFVEQCAKSLADLCRKEGLPWEVTACGWTDDEEADRITRSQVITLLRCFSLLWVKWDRFKKKYNETYQSAISEMSIHTACKGAVQILGKQDQNQSQVIIFYEVSPLVRIVSSRKVRSAVVMGVMKMLSSRPEQKIRLLDLVREYTSECGPLPLSASGQPLQEVLSSAPNLQFVGSKPSSIYLTLVSNNTQERRVVTPSKKNTAAAGNIDRIATEFRHLLKKQTPNCELPLNRLQQEYQTLYHHSFRVSDYVLAEGSKMRDLVEACRGLKLRDVRLPNNKVLTIVYLESEQRRGSDATTPATPEVVKRKVSERAAELPTDSIRDCECRVRELLCSLPGYQITLDRFLVEYEKKYGKMTGYYGHSKLSGLLESFTDTLELEESRGPSRLIKLLSKHILTYELTFLLSAHSGSLPINQIVPTYKQTFGRNFIVTEYGYPKLIRALEAMPEHIQLIGSGPSRIARLKKSAIRGTGSVTPFPVNHQQFVDEVMTILMSKHGLKMSIPELTKTYNIAFRQPSSLPTVSASQIVDALTKLPEFSLTGTGPTQYVQLVQEKEKEKKKIKTSPKPQREEPPPLPSPSPLKQPPPQPPQPPQGDTVETRAAKNKTLVAQMPQLEPALVPTPVAVTEGAGEGTRLDEKEIQRLCSETHRLLLCHQEHAMTVSELASCFKAADDPAQPSPEELYLCLKKQNTGKKKKTFQISDIPGSVGDSMIQLNRTDCLWKLGQDLLYLFVYRPTPELTLPTAHLLTLYQQCYGRKFVPAIYGVKTLEGVIETVKSISKLMTLDESKRICSLTDFGCRSVMSTLLAELLFLRGDECLIMDTDLPRLFQEHFSIPLHLSPLKVDSPSAMLSLPEIQNVVQAPYGRPELKSVHRFAEQLRQLLTQNSGRLPLDSLQGLYIASFGSPTDVDIHARGWLRKKLIHCAPHVVNLSGQRWAVWAPTGRPYPPRGGKVVPPLPAAKEWPLDCETGLQSRPQRAGIGSPLEEGRKKGEGGERERGGEEEGEGEGEKRVGEMKTEVVFNGPAAQQSTSEALALGRSPEDVHQWESSTATFGGDLPTEPPLLPPEDTHHSALGGRLHTDDQEVTDPLPPTNRSFNHATRAPLFPPLLTLQEEHAPQPLTQGQSPSPSPPSHGDAPPTSSSSAVALDDDDDGSPYGFLRKEPKLLAELTVKEEDIDNALSTTEALQKLLEAGSSAHTIELANLPPPVPPAMPSSPKKDATPHNSDPQLQGGPVDYLETGMSPDEVLQELYKVKDSSGGVLKPVSMEPFLNYFGELSRRELERLESQQSKSATPSKGMPRKKRMMAIRFPGQPQDPFPHTTDPELRKTLEAVQHKLPEVPDLSDSSDSDTCPQPVTRAELLKKLMGKEYFSSDKEDDQEKEMASDEAKVSLLYPPVNPVGSRAVGTSQAPDHSDQSHHSSDLPVLTGYGQEPHSQY